MKTLVCSRCTHEKSIDMFGKYKRKSNSGIILCYKRQCKTCLTDIQREKRIIEKTIDPIKYHEKWANYYAKTKEQNKLAKKAWLSIPENRNKRNDYIRIYKENRRLNDPSFKLFENHRKRIWKSLKNKNNSSKELLGCDINHYFEWITYTMTQDNNMSWDNYGTYWNIDHLIPVNNFDITIPEEVKKAFNWTNTWAMKSTNNFSKNSKIISEQITRHQNILQCFVNKIALSN
jgi:transcription elongation factor Elf1